jgi:hypothetical protein
MNSLNEKLTTRIRFGGWLAGTGVAAGLVAGVLMWQLPDYAFYLNFVATTAFVLAGTGVGLAMRYRAAQKGDVQARRLVSAEFDERSTLLRSRAGYRAWWLSFGLTASLLFWLLAARLGWAFPLQPGVVLALLALCVLAPLAVYLGSFWWESRRG